MRVSTIFGALAVLIAVIAASGCGDDASNPAGQQAQQAPSSQAAPANVTESKTIARSGELTVTQAELDTVLANHQRQIKMMFGDRKMPEEKDPKKAAARKARERKDAIRRIMAGKLHLKKAKESGLTVTDEEVKEKLDTWFKMYGGKEKYLELVGKGGLTEDRLRQETADSILKEKYIEKEVYSKLPEPTEDEMKEWYKKQKRQFGTPEMVKASIISVKVAEGASEADVAKAKEQLENLAKRIKKGESFESVAKEASQDRWAEKGGEMGMIRRQQARLGDDFDNASFSLAIGKMSSPIRTNEGFSIVKVTEKIPAKQKTYEESKEQIKKMLPGVQKFQASAKFYDRMKREIEIEFLGE
ncbi:peptidylprolyl isomerase [bacterium]|nr:peptidylprolyl isomerase [bacterium]